jgi:hypothetical protein
LFFSIAGLGVCVCLVFFIEHPRLPKIRGPRTALQAR